MPEVSSEAKGLFGCVYSIGPDVVQVDQQITLCKQMEPYFTYNSKIDNFLDIEKLQNFVVSSLTDEEVIKDIKVVGTL